LKKRLGFCGGIAFVLRQTPWLPKSGNIGKSSGVVHFFKIDSAVSLVSLFLTDWKSVIVSGGISAVLKIIFFSGKYRDNI
jgi:hypothetical protein